MFFAKAISTPGVKFYVLKYFIMRHKQKEYIITLLSSSFEKYAGTNRSRLTVINILRY